MSKQPKALGLADALETISRMGIGTKHDKEIAIELRRQHAEIERLQDVNKELLEAVTAYEAVWKEMFAHFLSNGMFNRWGKEFNCTNLNMAHYIGEKAIAKGEQA